MPYVLTVGTYGCQAKSSHLPTKAQETLEGHMEQFYQECERTIYIPSSSILRCIQGQQIDVETQCGGKTKKMSFCLEEVMLPDGQSTWEIIKD